MFETNKRHASGNIYARLHVNSLNLAAANMRNKINSQPSLRTKMGRD